MSQAKTLKNLKALVGQKVIAVDGYMITLEGGLIFTTDSRTLTMMAKLEKLAKVKSAKSGSVMDYLRSIGFDSFYSDKRADHYRVKVAQKFTESQLEKAKALETLIPGVTVAVEELSIPSWQAIKEERKVMRNGWAIVERIVIRTPGKPSKTMIS